MQQISDTATGLSATAAGLTGMAVQAATSYSNLFVAIGNAVLVTIGLYLAWPKFIKAWKERHRKN